MFPIESLDSRASPAPPYLLFQLLQTYYNSTSPTFVPVTNRISQENILKGTKTSAKEQTVQNQGLSNYNVLLWHISNVYILFNLF